jgi:hypothetical protein
MSKKHINAVPTQADIIGKNAEMETAVASIVKQDSDLKARIIAAAHDLNYFGKKLASSKLAVCEQLAEIFKDYAISVQGIENTLKGAEKPKAEKATTAKKEKAPDTRPIVAGTLSHTEETRPVLAGARFLVTSAQNNTPVHAAFLSNLERYAEYIGAKIVVFPFIYNKNGFQNGEGSDEIYYDPAVVKYIQTESAWLNDNRKVAAMAYNILPTVKAPLSGMREAIGNAEAMIVPHATIAHECVPVLGAQHGRVVPMLYSTGTVTLRNYINQAAGNKANNRHNFGALVVEFNGSGQFWVRQIETNESGVFQDMRDVVDSDGVTDSDIAVLNYGDIHAEKSDKAVAEMQWGDGNGRAGSISMLDYLRPRYQMAHDLLDFEALNHHNRDNHFHMAANQISGRTVNDDMTDVSDILLTMQRDYCMTVVVRSNHDDALDRWLSDAKYEPRKDPANALTYFQLQVGAYQHLQKRDHFDSLPFALTLATGNAFDAVRFLRASESFIIGGVELGEHGHSGINGSRGSPKQFAGNKCTTGHTHSSSIYGGCYTAGVSGKLAMGYNETGASSWVQSSVVQYVTGFRAVVHLKNDGTGKLAYMA